MSTTKKKAPPKPSPKAPAAQPEKPASAPLMNRETLDSVTTRFSQAALEADFRKRVQDAAADHLHEFADKLEEQAADMARKYALRGYPEGGLPSCVKVTSGAAELIHRLAEQTAGVKRRTY